jgi:Predicted transcriptional regulators
MIVLDYQDRRPIYEQIADKLQVLINKGVLEENAQMPSVRKMAMDLSINPNTIQRAYALLESKGYLYTIKGRGNFVSPKENFIDEEKEQFFKDLKAQLQQGIDMDIPLAQILERVKENYKEATS